MAKNAQIPSDSNFSGIPTILNRDGLREHFRYCSWNIEWMDYFFKDDNTFHTSNSSAGITDVVDLCKRIASAITDINPDVISILEGPSSILRMDLYQKTYLEDSFDCFGFVLIFLYSNLDFNTFLTVELMEILNEFIFL